MVQEVVENTMSNDEREIIGALFSVLPLFVLSIVAPVLAYYSLFMPDGELASVWFQRSGSITVMFAVWSEYNLSKANEHVNLSGIITNEQSRLSEKYSFKFKAMQFFGVLLGIVGTVIWGYGDLFM